MTRPSISLFVITAVLAVLGWTSVAEAVYSPDLGRWAQRDPIGTRPSVGGGPVRIGRQYLDGSNLYQYARSKSVTLLDPFGLKACCGPAVDGWFSKEINLHSSFWKKWTGGPLIRPFYFQNYARTVPYKWMDFGSDCAEDQGDACTGTVRLCGSCVHKSELGNLMYGAMGKLWLRGEQLIIGGGRRGGGTGKIDSPEDLAGVLGGIFLESGDLTGMSADSMCQLLKKDYSNQIGAIQTVFTDKLKQLFDEVDPKNLLGTMGANYGACADCEAGNYSGGHSDFSGVGTQSADLARNWNARNVYKNLPIRWPSDPKEDPCCKEGVSKQ